MKVLPAYQEVTVAYITLFGLTLDEGVRPNVGIDQDAEPKPTLHASLSEGYRLKKRLSLSGI